MPRLQLAANRKNRRRYNSDLFVQPNGWENPAVHYSATHNGKPSTGLIRRHKDNAKAILWFRDHGITIARDGSLLRDGKELTIKELTQLFGIEDFYIRKREPKPR